ncbi:HAD family hydrolase [Nocardiopsis lambiniae]|uniref:HAD-IA family hydrolase n=1 Tax=Nocardiopsis lambiniae TaxID=3075539 RepID=A0ABU2M6T4_9ACTN|nr:HAD-IA family hydrolase [Nocardiopsis sp. DSM 44743]MDT0328383.1 HAD-IA family hydrolase [Nocardiopsis sp. DSM 44743]
MSETDPVLWPDRVEAVLFDVDGVVTDTARVHAAAWKRLFDGFLRVRSGEGFEPFDEGDDYARFVDGRSRLDGVRAFLASRGVEVPETGTGDTVESLGARKDHYFLEALRRSGASAFPTVVAMIRRLRERGRATAAVSASRNCSEVLRAAGVEGLFDVRVDGVDAARLGLAGKPDPALFLEAARRLGVAPARAAVVEDAFAGVEAGTRGGFGFVVGVDPGGRAEGLYRRGAHTVISVDGSATTGRTR